jgi:hypothetical protein
LSVTYVRSVVFSGYSGFVIDCSLPLKKTILKSYPWWEHDCKQCIIVIRWRWDWLGVKVMVFNTTFSKIPVTSWRSVLLVKETRGPKENHRSAPRHWPTLSHNVVLRTPQLSGIWKYYLCPSLLSEQFQNQISKS